MYATVADVLSTVRAHVPNAHAAIALLTHAATLTPRGTARAWFRAHDGKRVDTIQATSSLWAPANREVDAHSRAGAVALDGSWRDYAGTRVLGADDHTLALSLPGGGIAVYRVREDV